jgi:hypothetical protein
MDDLHRRVRRTLLSTRAQLESLEAAASNPQLHPAASADIHAAFQANVAALAADVASMRAALARVPPPRRDVWRARLAALDEELTELRHADARVGGRLQGIAAEVRVREELLRRRRCGDGGWGRGRWRRDGGRAG